MTLSRFVLVLCLSFVGGILLASLIALPTLIGLGFFILGLAISSVFWRRKFIVILGFCLIALFLGILRYQAQERQIAGDQLRLYNDIDQEIRLIGVVEGEPDIRDTSIKLKIRVEKLKIRGEWELQRGRVLVSGRRYPEYRYGDRLRLTGILQTPAEFEDFNYRDYLKKDGIYSVMYWPETELLERDVYYGLSSAAYARILQFKEKLRESIYQNLSPPQGALLASMLWGDQRQISKDWKQKMNVTGVRHITAVSGQNITILTSILMIVLVGLGLWRQQAFYLTIVFITLFIIMTGLQSSAIRAGIMGGLFLLAQHLGRINASSRAIVFAATLMLAINPLLLRLDIGFQLSFMAMMGIIYLLPILQDKLRAVPDVFQVRGILAMTVSAYIFTLPILIYNFGYVSVVGILANILIVPLVYWIMIFGFLFILAGTVWQSLGWVLSWPVWLLLTYITSVIEWFSKLPFAFLTIELSGIWILAAYLVMGFVIWRVHISRRLRFLGPR